MIDDSDHHKHQLKRTPPRTIKSSNRGNQSSDRREERRLTLSPERSEGGPDNQTTSCSSFFTSQLPAAKENIQ